MTDHICNAHDYCMLSDTEFLIFCSECKRASAIVEFKITEKIKHKYDSKLIEDLR
jgi:hypothetical protein